MKFLHTADWHLGKRLERFDRTTEQAQVLNEICELAEAEQVDLILIAGDLYDAFNPPNRAVEDFYKALKRLSANGERAVIAIAGNHDSPQRIEAPDPLARECGIIFAGFPGSQVPQFRLDSGLEVLQSAPGFIELKLPRVQAPIRILLTPYANQSRMRKALSSAQAMREALQNYWQTLADKYCDDQGINLLVTHLFMMSEGSQIPEEPEDERPIRVGNASIVYTNCIPQAIQYAALGHLHRYQVMKGPCPVVYPSSLLGYNFAEAGQKKYVVIGQAEPGQEADFHRVELQCGYPLERKTFADIDQAVAWLQTNQGNYVELSIETDTWLTSQERNRLAEAHPRIIGPVPLIRNLNSGGVGDQALADPTCSREALFQEYFQHKKGQLPNAEIMALLTEILGEAAQ